MNAKIPGVVKNLEGPATYKCHRMIYEGPYKTTIESDTVKAYFVESGKITLNVYPADHDPKAFIIKQPEVHYVRSQGYMKVEPGLIHDVVVDANTRVYHMEWDGE